MTGTKRLLVTVLAVVSMLALLPRIGGTHIVKAADVTVSYDESTGRVKGTWSRKNASARNYYFTLQKKDGSWTDTDSSTSMLYYTNSSIPFGMNVNSGGLLRVKIEEKKEDGTSLLTYYSNEFTVYYDLSEAKFSSIGEQIYTGKAITPGFTVEFKYSTLTKGTDYTVTYSNNTNKGTATIKITGAGYYTGTASTTFRIVAPPDTGESVASGGTGGSGSGGASSSNKPSVSDFSVLVTSPYAGTAQIAMFAKTDSRTLEVQQDGKTIITMPSSKCRYNYLYGKAVIRYDKASKFRWRVKNSAGAVSPWKTVSVKSKKLSKPSLSVTKINANKVGLSWSLVSGATGYKIYAGAKVIKTLGAKKYSYLYSKKKAGSLKYKVVPVIKCGGMKKAKAGPASKAYKGKANQCTYSVNKDIKSVTYSYAPYRISKISLSGNTYTVTGYVVNNRIYKLQKYKKLNINIYCNGKKVASKTFKNLKVNCKDSGVKKLTVKIKGKGGVDLRHSHGYQAQWQEYWQYVGTKRLGD